MSLKPDVSVELFRKYFAFSDQPDFMRGQERIVQCLLTLGVPEFGPE